MIDYLRKVFTKKQIVWLIVSGGVLAVFTLIAIFCVRASRTQSAQLFAERFDKEGESTQISVFYSQMAEITEDTVKELSFNIDKKLDEEFITAKNENARRRISAYSASGETTVNSEKKSSKVKVIGVGGDYFLFHPLRLLSGSYFDGDDLMQDKILLDEEAAWDLYGSPDIVGKPVEIEGTRLIVAGVYKKDQKRFDKLSGNDKNTVYVSYESLLQISNRTDLECYEVLLPNPVSGYGMKIVKEAFHLEEDKFEIVENTKRFSWLRLIKRFKTIGSRSMNAKAIIYPYWENMARGLEDMLVPWVFIELMLITFVFVNVCVLLTRMWKNRTIHKSDVKNFIERRIEIYREEKKRKKEEGELI